MMIEEFLSSDGVLVIFSLLLGLLVGVFGERMRNERANQHNAGKIVRRED